MNKAIKIISIAACLLLHEIVVGKGGGYGSYLRNRIRSGKSGRTHVRNSTPLGFAGTETLSQRIALVQGLEGVIPDDQIQQTVGFRAGTTEVPVGGGYFVSGSFAGIVTPDGRYLYGAYLTSNNVSVIETSNNTVIGDPIDVGRPSYGIAVTPNGAYVYLANFVNATVSVIRTSDNTVIGDPIGVGSNPIGIAVTPDGQYVYVMPLMNNANQGSVISTKTNTVVGTF